MKKHPKKVYLLNKVPDRMGIMQLTPEWHKVSYDLFSNFKGKKVKLTVEEIDDENFEKLCDNFNVIKFFD